METPYRQDTPKSLDMFMEISALRKTIRRMEERLDQFECAQVEFLERRHRRNAPTQKDAPLLEQRSA